MINRRTLRSVMAPARWGKAASVLLRVAFLLMVGYVFVYPFLHMVVTAIKSYDDLHDVSVMWIPRSPTLQNFSIANGYLDYWKHFGISVFLALFTIGAKITFCAFIAYGFARYDFAGKKLMFCIVILSMIIPVQTLLLPQYIMAWLLNTMKGRRFFALCFYAPSICSGIAMGQVWLSEMCWKTKNSKLCLI